MSRSETSFVTERYKVLPEQSEWLKQMEIKYKIAPSSLVRLAIDLLKPKFCNHGAMEESIAKVVNDKK